MLGPGEDDDKILVGITIACTSEDQVVRVSEAFARIAVGFSLEGLNVNHNMLKMSPEDYRAGGN